MKIRHCPIIRYTAIIAAATLAVFLLYPARAFAIESITLPVQAIEDDVVSISLPVISESETSVFDFIMDPQELLYMTDAARYGGGRVEEGATLLFYNKEGEYDFSKHSDWLTVTNRSTVPVQLTVTAQVTDFGDIKLAKSADFGESTEPEVYLAIEDGEGNILPLSADGQTAIHLEMSAVPENTYVFRLDEENHTYRYGMSMDPDMIDFDTYSFGLVGACNSNAEWQGILINPTITVTWCVEPIIPEEPDEISEEEFVEEGNESTTNDDTEKDGLVDESDDENVEGNVSEDLDDGNQSDYESDDGNEEDNKENSEEDSASDDLDEEQSDHESGGGNEEGNVSGRLRL